MPLKQPFSPRRPVPLPSGLAGRLAPGLLAGLVLLSLHAMTGGSQLTAQETEVDSAAHDDSVASARPGAAPAAPAFMAGTVVSASDGRPLAGAFVSLARTGVGAITDSAGHFRIPRTLAGPDTVSVHFVGYETSKTEIELAPEKLTRVVFLLSPTVVRVAEIYVEVPRERRPGPMANFERRASRRAGYFLSPEDIQKRQPRLASDALRGVPGIDVGAPFMGKAPVRMTRHVGDCAPNIFLDGIYMPRMEVDDLRVDDLGAIEVYRSPSEVPAEFKSMTAAGCGAIVIWSAGGER